MITAFHFLMGNYLSRIIECVRIRRKPVSCKDTLWSVMRHDFRSLTKFLVWKGHIFLCVSFFLAMGSLSTQELGLCKYYTIIILYYPMKYRYCFYNGIIKTINFFLKKITFLKKNGQKRCFLSKNKKNILYE